MESLLSLLCFCIKENKNLKHNSKKYSLISHSPWMKLSAKASEVDSVLKEN
jgi:hypothetical protein